MTRLLVLGSTGQLGLALQRLTLPRGWEIQTLARADLDLADTGAVETALRAARPQVVINASGYTEVDKAERYPELAFALNSLAPAAMARAAYALSAPLVHVSTDYVFNGEKNAPYLETDAVDPINVYGRSKAEGEAAVLSSIALSAVVRTSWVFSADRANFLKTMLRLGETRRDVRVVADQRGRPTPANELARICVALAERLLDGDKNACGLFHCAGAGEATWADFAEAIFSEAERYGCAPVQVQRISTAEYPTPARRPANSRLDTTKIEALGLTPMPWRDSMRDYVKQLLR
ncbi:MAG: dTDP-4-dehydrorhamnose reductase [Hyphomonadaceae bacterium]|nr:dTDP-4-dehydrorhamnose reductase [Hyphomonadaceae bacterium]